MYVCIQGIVWVGVRLTNSHGGLVGGYELCVCVCVCVCVRVRVRVHMCVHCRDLKILTATPANTIVIMGRGRKF